MLMHQFHEKSSRSLSFVWNQSLSLKSDELRSWIKSSFPLLGENKWVFLMEIHDIDSLVLQKKHLQPWFYLESKLSLKRDELRLWIESGFFSLRAMINGQLSLGYTILLCWFCDKSICSHRLFWNQSLSLKRGELHPWIESNLFVRGAKKNGQFSLEYTILMGWFHEKSIRSLRFVWNLTLS